MRLEPAVGGDPNVVFHYQPLNDTGSNVQTIFQVDFNVLNQGVQNTIAMPHFTFPGAITTANSQVAVLNTFLQLFVIAQTGDPANPWRILMDWQNHLCVVMPAGPCLSGDVMRNRLFFCTKPKGTRALYLADNKTTLINYMPAN
ncbi:hypothetical protein B0T26DRAFT_747527 [Lasiosphaeria miniovina]|uniref:Uncharacterized protein n=1 Tax=Lasiosphaeria miniovina TaxID=1954250 RepID=A0AA40B3U2_9PEZI|nr:uncharacterized protein B0T26DRAFT_747527 [Lasiosphaeria miniovina]KAK0727169.1 hypothetical protein B0T26DRAFT_747527 [Lasiosphaeria miniovina]